MIQIMFRLCGLFIAPGNLKIIVPCPLNLPTIAGLLLLVIIFVEFKSVQIRRTYRVIISHKVPIPYSIKIDWLPLLLLTGCSICKVLWLWFTVSSVSEQRARCAGARAATYGVARHTVCSPIITDIFHQITAHRLRHIASI